MRLIDEDAVRDVIYGMHVNGEEGVENALRNTYGADLREILYEIYELPTVCDIEQIRAEIEHVIDYTYDSTDYDKALYNGAYKDGLYEALDIINKHTKGENE